MLETHMTDGHEPVSLLPDSLRRAVLDSVHERVDAPVRPAPDASFRERLEARRAVRPQSTLAITSGIQYPTLEAGRARSAPIRAARPKRPVNAVTEPQPRRAPMLMRAMSSMGGALPAITLSNGLSLGGGDGDDDSKMGERLSKLSQLAFAGLAVLGFAGLSFMAADNALTGNDTADGDEDAAAAETRAALKAATSQRITSSQASALAMASASAPMDGAAQPWFDYKAIAFDIAARNEAQVEAQRAAEMAASAEAERRAAAAIAEAEAQQLAEEQRLARLAEATRLADATAEKRRLAEEEAARVARMEAIRQAELDAEQAAAMRAEATRLAELEARRIAHAEAEAMRLANLEADRLAEARRVAAAEVQALRAPVQYVSMANAVSLPVAPTPQVKPLVRTPKAKPAATWAAYSGPMPTTASLKPSKPLVLVAQTPVERAVPPALKPNAAHVRAFDRPVPVQQASQKVEAFMAERVQRTADAPVSEAALETLQAEFLTIVNSAQDGTVSEIVLPEGGRMEITIEQTTTREASRPVLKTVSYSVSEYRAVQRSVTAQVDRNVTLTCRDLSYVIPGKERGRFAACESGKGEWLISRATEDSKSSI
ncbi:MAG: hypothetical protein ABJL57_00930 [Hyphomonas sp.]|uniref:hypothetical protein n=1 Tax=Hyphomonas sp. TaxID=87 RepID=UPI003262F95B